jgi:hypothetical protein
MKLNENEMKLFRNLQNSHLKWLKRDRYFLLVTGIILAAPAVYCLNYSERLFLFFHSDWSNFMGTLFCVQSYYFAGIAGVMIGITLFRWNGNPRDILLIKILEDKIDNESNG